MKHVTKYIEKGWRDIVTSRDLVEALNHGQRMKGFAEELFDVNTDCD